MDENGNVGGSWYIEGGKIEGKVTPRRVAIVWDVEICRIGGAVANALLNNILILSNPQAANITVKKVGKTRKAKTRQLRQVLVDIKCRQEQLIPVAVTFA